MSISLRALSSRCQNESLFATCLVVEGKPGCPRVDQHQRGLVGMRSLEADARISDIANVNNDHTIIPLTLIISWEIFPKQLLPRLMLVVL
jgi:hypothetical protein